MATHADIADRFAQEAGKPDANLLLARSGNVFVSGEGNRTLYSYGKHFPLVHLMLDRQGNRSWWLLNGDTYSVSTARHQTITRNACKRTGLPMLTVPFSCLTEAGILKDTIEPVDVEPERWDTSVHVVDSIENVPSSAVYTAKKLSDGRYEYRTYRHWLGAALFRATYRVSERELGAYFLSAFDEQETTPHYFLCELPGDARPRTVRDAFLALKPPEVVAAEAAGVICTRQGDVFAVPTRLTTRELAKLTPKRERGAHVLHLSHKATEVAIADDGTTYARGVLHHAPFESWRRPEHRRRLMGDRRTWHLLVKNTVPVDSLGRSRAWSRGGNVD
ncbi:hypothetical protein [Amycolatopsis sacchari]|uniref:Uncharacterized protein n=1 Tax=Amycolatopsis sacchari TaxID=115433 RepID=A0A1I4AAX2_9PSEU|nr:hypothetical protein [Amycolatopsis sacchari]SFK53582.1 hypothetical protein SAMN05421835_123109 [Amycolatopsis sacchari]